MPWCWKNVLLHKTFVVIGFDTNFCVGYFHNANISTPKMFVFLFNRKSFNETNERVYAVHGFAKGLWCCSQVQCDALWRSTFIFVIVCFFFHESSQFSSNSVTSELMNFVAQKVVDSAGHLHITCLQWAESCGVLLPCLPDVMGSHGWQGNSLRHWQVNTICGWAESGSNRTQWRSCASWNPGVLSWYHHQKQ